MLPNLTGRCLRLFLRRGADAVAKSRATSPDCFGLDIILGRSFVVVVVVVIRRRMELLSGGGATAGGSSLSRRLSLSLLLWESVSESVSGQHLERPNRP